MRRALAAALIGLLLVGCGPLPEQSAPRDDIAQVSSERLDTLLVSVKGELDDVQEAMVPLLLVLGEYVTAYDVGIAVDAKPPFDTAALDHAMTLCFSNVHVLGILEFLELNQSSPLEVIQASTTADVPNGILYGSARTFLAQTCRQLDAAQRLINGGNESLGLRPDLVVNQYREARDHLGDGNVSLIGAIKTLPAGVGDAALERFGTPEPTVARPAIQPPISPMVPVQTLDERRVAELPVLGQQIDAINQNLLYALETQDDSAIVAALQDANASYYRIGEQLVDLDMKLIAASVISAAISYEQAAVYLEAGDKEEMDYWVNSATDFLLEAAQGMSAYR